MEASENRRIVVTAVARRRPGTKPAEWTRRDAASSILCSGGRWRIAAVKCHGRRRQKRRLLLRISHVGVGRRTPAASTIKMASAAAETDPQQPEHRGCFDCSFERIGVGSARLVADGATPGRHLVGSAMSIRDVHRRGWGGTPSSAAGQESCVRGEPVLYTLGWRFGDLLLRDPLSGAKATTMRIRFPLLQTVRMVSCVFSPLASNRGARKMMS